MIQTKKITLFRSSDPRPDITLSLFLTPHLEVYAACIFRHSILAFYLASILTSYLASFLASIRTFSLAFYLAFLFHILSWYSIWHLFWHSLRLGHSGTRHCPLRSGACGWGPPVPTDIWNWDLELAVQRQCPLRSGAPSSAAVPTEIWSSQFSGSAHWDLELEGRKAKQLW